MAPMGFIHDKLDIKLLALYLLNQVVAPIDFTLLTDLAMCDPGVDYFAFAEALGELVQSGHIVLEDSLYSITEKGRRNGTDSQSSLSPVIRKRCDQRLVSVNSSLRRRAQVRTQVEDREDGQSMLRLSLDDNGGNLLTLEMAVPSLSQGEQMARGFRIHPEEVYHSILDALHQASEEEKAAL